MQDLTVTLFQSTLHWENAEKNLQAFEKRIGNLKDRRGPVDVPLDPAAYNEVFQELQRGGARAGGGARTES